MYFFALIIAIILFLVYRHRQKNVTTNLENNKGTLWIKRIAYTFLGIAILFFGISFISGLTYKGSDSSSETVKTYKSGFKNVTYDQLARTPKKYKNKPVKLSGEVMQVQNRKDGSSLLLVYQDGDGDSIDMVVVDKKDQPSNGKILEKDSITIQGTAYGTKKYDTTGNSKNEVPLIYTDKNVVDNGKSSDY